MNKFFVIGALFLVGCERVNTTQIVDRYYLVVVDTQNNLNISYKVDSDGFVAIVENYVFAVGNDENYIIAKQHPQTPAIIIGNTKGKISFRQNTSYNGKIDTTITNYFIIPIYKKFTYYPEKGIIGPLDLNQFNKYTKLLKIKARFKYWK